MPKAWRDRFHTVREEDHADLEVRAAVHEIAEGLPRHQAEEKAYGAWLKGRATHASAFHLSGMRAAHASGDMKSASLHATRYAIAMKLLGHHAVGEPPEEVAALARDSEAHGVYTFRPHEADDVVVGGAREKRVAKGEAVPPWGVPVEVTGDRVTWNMTHLLPKGDKTRYLHVQDGGETLTAYLFKEEGLRSPFGTIRESDLVSSGIDPDDRKAVTRAFELRKAASRAEVLVAAKGLAEVMTRAKERPVDRANTKLAVLAKAEPTKISRATFIYLDPKEPKDRFAQCETCMMFTGDGGKTCTIHGPDVEITGGMSCDLYVHGEPMVEEKGHEMKAVTPEESGLVDRQVRCENCVHFDGEKTCHLFVQLNETLPDTFDLDPEVDAKGCCNAQTPKP